MFGVSHRAIAYHDACYLGRYNDVYEPGRRVLEGVPGNEVVEMDLHHRRGMCCGAGGARMWMEEHEGRRINHVRSEQALGTGAAAIATACPFCLVMLRDGTTDLDRKTSRSGTWPSSWPMPPASGSGTPMVPIA